MKVFCLNSGPKGCYVIDTGDVKIMLDCPLDDGHLLSFLPPGFFQQANGCSSDDHELKPPKIQLGQPPQAQHTYKNEAMRVRLPNFRMVDVGSVDVVLISNVFNMLALPFLTEYTDFRGQIFATDPTIYLGGLLMEELSQQLSSPNHLSLPPPVTASALLQKQTLGEELAEIYSITDVKSCLAKITPFSYLQERTLLPGITVTPSSAGHCVGSSVWTITLHSDKFVYMSDGSLGSSGASQGQGGRESYSWHPPPLDMCGLKGAGVLLMGNLNAHPQFATDQLLSQIFGPIGATLSSGGSVLLPCQPTGTVYDLIELVDNYLNAMNLMFPIYFISPVAHQSLQYLSITGEWCGKARQERIYAPRMPFSHLELVDSGRLRPLSSYNMSVGGDEKKNTWIKDLNERPSVVFVSSPTLRCGDGVEMLYSLRNNPNNTLLLTEPNLDVGVAIEPLKPHRMRVQYCPIDTRINLMEANKIVTEIQPGHLLVPASGCCPPSAKPEQRNNIFAPESGAKSVVRPLSVLSLRIEPKFTQGVINQEICHHLRPNKWGEGEKGYLANVTASLRRRPEDFLVCVDPPSLGDVYQLRQTSRRYIWGSLSVKRILSVLTNYGIDNTHVTPPSSSSPYYSIHLPSYQAEIQLGPNRTTIVTQSDIQRDDRDTPKRTRGTKRGGVEGVVCDGLCDAMTYPPISPAGVHYEEVRKFLTEIVLRECHVLSPSD